nr:reverse transcriptase domain-containing protein [Tanacetum cinerariifolium]
MVTKLRNEITNFRQRPDESLFEAWECYKLLIDRCPNHNMLPVTQIDTFYNGLTLRHRDIINADAGGTFMKRRPEECYDLIENMTAHHNDWDTSAQRSESSSSITSFSDPEIVALKAEMAEINKNLMKVIQINQQVKGVTHSCETYGGPHSYNDCPATVGHTQNVYAAGAYNQGAWFNQNQNRSNPNQNYQNRNQGNNHGYPQGNNQGRNQFFQGANYGQNPPPTYQASGYQALVQQAPIPQPQVGITTRSRIAYKGPMIPTTASPPKVVERETEVTKDTVPPTNNRSTKDLQPSVVQVKTQVPNSEPVVAPVVEPVEAPVSAQKPNPKPLIPNPSRLHDQKLREKASDQMEKNFQIFQDLNFNISFADALILMPKFALTIKSLLTNNEKLLELARTSLNEHCSAVLLKKLPQKMGDPDKFLIPCDFPGMDKCLALTDLGASINIMPLSTIRALIDVYEGELTVPVGNRAVTFNLDQTLRYSSNYDDMSANRIDVAYILILEEFLNDDPSSPPLPSQELKVVEPKNEKSSIDEPPVVELKDLPPHLEYAFLEGDNKLPVIIAKDLKDEEKTALIKVMLKYGVTHRLATAYHPQTSGQVEVSNRSLKIILERTVGDNSASWSDKLDDALWVFCKTFKTPIGCTPYKLVYEKACHLPIELEHKAYWALRHENFDLLTTGDHRKVQLNELNELRDQAYENSLIYKEKTKKIHDSKIKDRVFNVGDRVILFNSRLKIFSGKLKTRWTGPFTVTQVFPYGTVELSQTDGPNFMVNGHRIKHYFGEDIPHMVVPNLQTFPKGQ